MIKPIGSTIEQYTNIAIVDRGHHLEHMVDFVKDHLKGLSAKDYALWISTSLLEDQRKLEEEKTYAEYLTKKYSELISTRWFLKISQAIFKSAYTYTKCPYLEEEILENGLTLEDEDIEILLKGVLAYFTNQISPAAFELYFKSDQLNFDKISVDTITNWGNELSFVNNELEAHRTEIQNTTVEVFNGFIQLLLFIFDSQKITNFLYPLLQGPDQFYKAMQEYINIQNAELDYYNDIQIGSQDSNSKGSLYKTSLRFATKIQNALESNPDGLVVINTNPGELCNYNNIRNPGCARHCLRHYNISGDQRYLRIIEKFIIKYPLEVDKFKITKVNDQIVEAAFPISFLLNRNFRFSVKAYSADEEDLDDYYDYEEEF